MRPSNDRDPAREQEGADAPHNRRSDEGAQGRTQDVDPDSAQSQVDRDDLMEDDI